MLLRCFPRCLKASAVGSGWRLFSDAPNRRVTSNALSPHAQGDTKLAYVSSILDFKQEQEQGSAGAPAPAPAPAPAANRSSKGGVFFKEPPVPCTCFALAGEAC
jgi:hypothetical protein